MHAYKHTHSCSLSASLYSFLIGPGRLSPLLIPTGTHRWELLIASLGHRRDSHVTTEVWRLCVLRGACVCREFVSCASESLQETCRVCLCYYAGWILNSLMAFDGTNDLSEWGCYEGPLVPTKLSCFERVEMNHTGSLTLAWPQCRAANKEKETEWE